MINQKDQHQSVGFTIVELLIVIVVIGILAAITIVAYNGIQNRANDVAVQSDLSNFHKRMEMQRSINGAYPATNGLTGIDLKVSLGSYDLNVNNLLYCVSTDQMEYGLAAVSKSGKVTYVNTNGKISDYSQAWSQASSTTCPNIITAVSYSATWGSTGTGGWAKAL